MQPNRQVIEFVPAMGADLIWSSGHIAGPIAWVEAYRVVDVNGEGMVLTIYTHASGNFSVSAPRSASLYGDAIVLMNDEACVSLKAGERVPFECELECAQHSPAIALKDLIEGGCEPFDEDDVVRVARTVYGEDDLECGCGYCVQRDRSLAELRAHNAQFEDEEPFEVGEEIIEALTEDRRAIRSRWMLTLQALFRGRQ